MIACLNELPIYEIDGKEVPPLTRPVLIVKSHWNRPEFVVFQNQEGDQFTVSANDLIAAIKNATNTNRLFK